MLRAIDLSGRREEKVVVFSAPSGTGKGTVKGLLQAISPVYRNLAYMYSRPTRPGEVSGDEFVFLNEAAILAYPDSAVIRKRLYETHWQALRRSDLEAAFCADAIHILEVPRLLAVDILNEYPNVQSIFLSPRPLGGDINEVAVKDDLARRQRERAVAAGVDIDERELELRLTEGIQQLRTASLYRDVVVLPSAPPGVERVNIVLKAALSFLEITIRPFLDGGTLVTPRRHRDMA